MTTNTTIEGSEHSKTESRSARLVRRLSALRERSGDAWEMTVETAGSDERVSAASDAQESAEAAWDAAIEAVERGDEDAALASLEEARTLGNEWGDSSDELEAIEMLKAPATRR